MTCISKASKFSNTTVYAQDVFNLSLSYDPSHQLYRKKQTYSHDCRCDVLWKLSPTFLYCEQFSLQLSATTLLLKRTHWLVPFTCNVHPVPGMSTFLRIRGPSALSPISKPESSVFSDDPSAREDDGLVPKLPQHCLIGECEAWDEDGAASRDNGDEWWLLTGPGLWLVWMYGRGEEADDSVLWEECVCKLSWLASTCRLWGELTSEHDQCVVIVLLGLSLIG